MGGFLIAIRKSTHTTHHAENVVVHGVDADARGVDAGDRVVRQREEERRIVNTGEVARA